MAEDDDEWEYEYDTNDPEVHYITVDFSTHSPLSQSDHAKSLPSNPSRQLQILDLHTSNPLISYDSQLYTCNWATDLGTTLHLTSPSTALPTRTRLLAVPARLTPLNPAPPPAPTTTADHIPWTLQTREGDSISYSPHGEASISIAPNSTPAKRAQASFLERWAALRASKGNAEPVPLKPVTNYVLPEGWEEERRKAVESAREEARARGDERRMRRRRKGKERAGEGERRVRFAADEGEGDEGDGSRMDVDDD